jgi:pimeloyl-ACP methyl ester carboxylesterase
MDQSAIFLPGIIAPAAIGYGRLVERLGNVKVLVRDLAVYDTNEPPTDFSIATELDALDRAADAAGFERFHLYGHSGGGAVALGYAAARGDRLTSLAVDEPASDFTPEGNEVYGWPEFDKALTLPPAEAPTAFMRLQVAQDVQLPENVDATNRKVFVASRSTSPRQISRPRATRCTAGRSPTKL